MDQLVLSKFYWDFFLHQVMLQGYDSMNKSREIVQDIRNNATEQASKRSFLGAYVCYHQHLLNKHARIANYRSWQGELSCTIVLLYQASVHAEPSYRSSQMKS